MTARPLLSVAVALMLAAPSVVEAALGGVASPKAVGHYRVAELEFGGAPSGPQPVKPRAVEPEAVTSPVDNETPTRATPPKVDRSPLTTPLPKPRPPRVVPAIALMIAPLPRPRPAYRRAAPAPRPALTARERAGLLQQLSRCWRVDTSRRGTARSVTLGMRVRRSGMIVPASLRVVAPMPALMEFRTAIGNARSALLDLRCQPLTLPPGKYAHWRELEITFDPKGMALQ